MISPWLLAYFASLICWSCWVACCPVLTSVGDPIQIGFMGGSFYEEVDLFFVVGW